ncbi:hypothetical protein GNZ12_07960 [Paraburkholderia sp. 1N]|uniref:Uncharacterized protein n=1 Tax=Paraburkholderia solitsugae TaxID=2675748 RepID=A0ABX2BJY2_9BURK|nr:hypothetical protein [Paraburkholderia solitsugae]NPT41252.1 hypothetical protein [Paraburkholderia solitsugae]
MKKLLKIGLTIGLALGCTFAQAGECGGYGTTECPVSRHDALRLLNYDSEVSLGTATIVSAHATAKALCGYVSYRDRSDQARLSRFAAYNDRVIIAYRVGDAAAEINELCEEGDD